MTLRVRSNHVYACQNIPVYSENKNQEQPTNMDVSATLTPTETNVIQISAERLKALEAVEASLPDLIQNAILEYKKSNLRRLHEKDKANPENVNKRVKRYAEKHREEINAKRREKRRLLKASATINTNTVTIPTLTIINPNGNYVPFD